MKKYLLFSFTVVILCLSLMASSVVPITSASTTRKSIVGEREKRDDKKRKPLGKDAETRARDFQTKC